MIGAILGDIIGSRFEFSPTIHTDFELFTDGNTFTDDTVLITAVADSLLNHKDMVRTLKEWYNKYPNNGPWGPNFMRWVNGFPLHEYSAGNGALVRLASAPFLISDPCLLLEFTKNLTKITHNSEEALTSTHMAMEYAWRLRNYNDRDPALLYTGKVPNMLMSYKALWLQTTWSSTCYNTLPQAVQSFKQSTSFEDAIRRAVSFGSDSDTMTAVTGIFAECYYGLEEFDRKYDIEGILHRYLPDDILAIIAQFKEAVNNG